VVEVERHKWPRAVMWDFSNVRAACQALRNAGYAVVAGADRLDRTAQLKPAMYLRGTEQFMADLVLEPAIAECILEHVAQFYLEYNRRFFEAAGGTIDIFFMGDDMGTQNSTWVSPEMYRRFFKKRFAAYCDLAHEFGAKTMYHTCGRVTSLVGEFVDAGLDILQSLQPAAMGDELAQLKRDFGGVLCFQGGIDIQNVLPKGSPQDVRQHVRDRAAILGPGGGYIFGTAHNILPDVPIDNVLALFDAYQEFGKY
jgi:uroporphyrinogen decarboxylase